LACLVFAGENVFMYGVRLGFMCVASLVLNALTTNL
jgi:hypothetical protein